MNLLVVTLTLRRDAVAAADDSLFVVRDRKYNVVFASSLALLYTAASFVVASPTAIPFVDHIQGNVIDISVAKPIPTLPHDPHDHRVSQL